MTMVMRRNSKQRQVFYFLMLLTFIGSVGFTGCSEETTSKKNDDSSGMLDSYPDSRRPVWQKPELVIHKLGDLSGKTVADIGASDGFFALRLTPLAKKVIAIDIMPQFVEQLNRKRREYLDTTLQQRLEPRLAQPDDPNLAKEEVDVVLIVNTYVYINNRIEYLKKIYDALTPGGKILIVDFKKKRTPIGPSNAYRLPLYQVENDLEAAGFRYLNSDDQSLSYQYITMGVK